MAKWNSLPHGLNLQIAQISHVVTTDDRQTMKCKMFDLFLYLCRDPKASMDLNDDYAVHLLVNHIPQFGKYTTSIAYLGLKVHNTLDFDVASDYLLRFVECCPEVTGLYYSPHV